MPAVVRHTQRQIETWSPLPVTPIIMSSVARTDDLGRYRIVGLTPRDYMVEVDLELQDRDIGITIGSGATSTMYRPVARISFFSGDTARKRDAKSFKLGPGEE